jgi:hypothetical protein
MLTPIGRPAGSIVSNGGYDKSIPTTRVLAGDLGLQAAVTDNAKMAAKTPRSHRKDRIEIGFIKVFQP